MSGKAIFSAFVGSLGIAYVCDYLISDKKIFGGSTPSTVSNKEWELATEKKFRAWPRTAGPPVVMNPISSQNFIVKASLNEAAFKATGISFLQANDIVLSLPSRISTVKVTFHNPRIQELTCGSLLNPSL
ncbi:uncharacterized protein LOC125189165 isoform X1 [Salvia hispanica]|uniref:uncharacterized protein LOC125189165 isoform X1 n=1 Tax=Salvia hispanica TaxID=49212 RepID=UPI002009A580|nr:uncharacterized protein LOC125189165 isoform X1 [Salvia hispanica]